MSEYNPDRWEIIRLEDDKKVIYKILVGWSGGYLDSDNWRISSGLKSIEESGDYYLMHNYSGSVYKCHKKCKGMTALSSNVFSIMKKEADMQGVKISTISVKGYLDEKEKEES